MSISHRGAALARISLMSALVLALGTPAALAQSSIDLNTWMAESYPSVSGFGAGQWNVAPGGQTVQQVVNGQPTLFYSDFDAFNTQITGQINVSGSDDDYIGFALGYQPNDATNPNADYLLVDWKRNNQSFNFGAPSCTPSSLAAEGLAVSRVSGIPTADEFWGHVDFDSAACSPLGQGLTELQRGATLGSTGWTFNQNYAFQFVFSAQALQVFVDGSLEINITGNFANGRIAFYNFSQAGVTYDAFTVAVHCPSEPIQENYGSGYPGTLGIPGLSLSADPIVGTTVSLLGGNSSNTPTAGFLLVGTSPTSLFFSPFLAEFSVDPFSTSTLSLELAVPAGGLVIPIAIPLDQSLCGLTAYVQLLQIDVGAPPYSVSLSPGLRSVIGE